MGGDFGAAVAVDQLEPRHRTTLIIGAQNDSPEDAIADDPEGRAALLQGARLKADEPGMCRDVGGP